MRTLRLAAASMLLLAGGGCLGSGGHVDLTVSQVMGQSPAFTGFASDDGAVITGSSDGALHFTAKDGTTTLTIVVVSGHALTAGQQIDLAEAHNYVSIDLPNAGWSSNGGTLVVDSVSPDTLELKAVPMLAGSGDAKGTFQLDGKGTFK